VAAGARWYTVRPAMVHAKATPYSGLTATPCANHANSTAYTSAVNKLKLKSAASAPTKNHDVSAYAAESAHVYAPHARRPGPFRHNGTCPLLEAKRACRSKINACTQLKTAPQTPRRPRKRGGPALERTHVSCVTLETAYKKALAMHSKSPNQAIGYGSSSGSQHKDKDKRAKQINLGATCQYLLRCTIRRY